MSSLSILIFWQVWKWFAVCWFYALTSLITVTSIISYEWVHIVMIVYIYVFGLYFSFLKINSVLPRWRSIIQFPLLVELEEVILEHRVIISGGTLSLFQNFKHRHWERDKFTWYIQTKREICGLINSVNFCYQSMHD